MSDVAVRPSWRQRLSPHSFRGKFILVVGAAVLFDMLMGGGIALWNVQRLSRDAAEQVGAGLTKASREYPQTYVDATALRADPFLRAVGELLVFPDGHFVLEVVDQSATGLEGLTPVGTRHGDDDGEVTDAQIPHAVDRRERP